MQKGIHFISGLPRSGSTLLSALLRQNPALHAHITSPIGSLVNAVLRDISQGNETSVFLDDPQRERILRGLFNNYYEDIALEQTVFDTNRGWTAQLELIGHLFPDCKVICCVRPIPWIIDSLERLIRKNKFELSKIFGFETGMTVYSRADGLMRDSGLIGFPLAALKQAMNSPMHHRLLLVPYDVLSTEPRTTLDAIYDFVGLPRFEHDPENIRFSTQEFDARLGTPGLHDIGQRAAASSRETILPADLWARYEPASLWRDPDINKNNVRILGDSPN